MNRMWENTLAFIEKYGHRLESRDGSSAEIIGFSEKLEAGGQNFLINPVRNLDPHYACAEFLWYLSMTDDTSFLQLFAPSYSRFCEDGIHAFGAYGQRWKANSQIEGMVEREDQLSEVIETLKRHPESRQAIITMWHGTDLEHAINVDKKDLPCTLTHQFLLRNEYLHLVTTMRSNDVWLGMPYDVFCNTQLQKLVADILGVSVGSYTHNAGSMHYYERNFDKIDQVLSSKKKDMLVETPASLHRPSMLPEGFVEQVEPAINFVKAIIAKYSDEHSQDVVDTVKLYHSVIADAAFVCASKFKPEMKEHIYDPLLRMAVDNFQS